MKKIFNGKEDFSGKGFLTSLLTQSGGRCKVLWASMLFAPRAWAVSTADPVFDKLEKIVHSSISSGMPLWLLLLIGLLAFLLGLFIWLIQPYLVCRKIHHLQPSLSKKELWWPAFRGMLLGGFVQLVLELAFFIPLSISCTLNDLSINSLGSFLILYILLPYITLFYATRWMLCRAFVRGNWESRGIALDIMKHSIRKGVNSSIIRITVFIPLILAATFLMISFVKHIFG